MEDRMMNLSPETASVLTEKAYLLGASLWHLGWPLGAINPITISDLLARAENPFCASFSQLLAG